MHLWYDLVSAIEGRHRFSPPNEPQSSSECTILLGFVDKAIIPLSPSNSAITMGTRTFSERRSRDVKSHRHSGSHMSFDNTSECSTAPRIVKATNSRCWRNC